MRRYKDRLLVWTVLHDKQTDSWTPAITISWTVDRRNKFHRFNGPPQISHAAALALGKQLAEAWVDKEL
jgi:hypothetical protein